MSERKSSSGEYIDARTAGRMLDMSRESIYRAVARGEIRALKIGSSLRLPRAQFELLLADDDYDSNDQGRCNGN